MTTIESQLNIIIFLMVFGGLAGIGLKVWQLFVKER